jgi:hypothetical protein
MSGILNVREGHSSGAIIGNLTQTFIDQRQVTHYDDNILKYASFCGRFVLSSN